ncbi:marvel domain-containing protein [Microdochium trichocladiopsis]|uniref:Marvel domain-containing protein n=1 Tax=Microdochium trichocladiopsis TaxID=1682393 RepID=A0A9P8XUS9_9PEZI|nr:marvel domain-containing protein [Microdochium trichocladiopsis]KAH7018488.1 marvel domain-containing protein [Microdochium trichocladiopsis]
MAFELLTIVHAVAFVFAIIELGLTAYAAQWFFFGWAAPTVNFMVFNSVWSILVLIYVGVIPLVASRIFHKLVSFGLNALTALFWFAGSIALAVRYGPSVSCNGNNVCGSTKAAIAFGFFLWAIFTALAVIDGLGSFRNRGVKGGSRV